MLYVQHINRSQIHFKSTEFENKLVLVNCKIWNRQHLLMQTIQIHLLVFQRTNIKAHLVATYALKIKKEKELKILLYGNLLAQLQVSLF